MLQRHIGTIEKCYQSPLSSTVSREYESPFQLPVQSSKCEKTNPETCQQSGTESEVKRMIQLLEQQASSALQGKHVCVCVCGNVISSSSLEIQSTFVGNKNSLQNFSLC